jgi:uncharacterized protein
MGKYIKRILESKVLEYVKSFPAVSITGPRQSGKSTLLKHILADQYQYVTFDKDHVRNMFYEDPKRFMSNYQNRVIFDEAQKAPEIFEYIKVAIDEDRDNYGKYIITGSAQFLLLKQISESLAGRVGLLTLLPLQYQEIPPASRNESIYRGAYPEIVVNGYANSYDWYASYIDTYVERDVRGLHNIGDLRDFRRLLGLLAANTSQILNMSRYASDLGVAVSTIKRWLSVLEASYIIFLLPPYYKNYGKRIVKNPKIYFYDTGLVSHLTGINSEELFLKGPMAGAIFENYIIAEIMKKELHFKTFAELYYYRTGKGAEVDLIVDRKINKDVIEIKLNNTFNPRMIKQLKTLLEPNDKGYLLYTGEKLDYSFAENIKVCNYNEYLADLTPLGGSAFFQQ